MTRHNPQKNSLQNIAPQNDVALCQTLGGAALFHF